MKHQMESQTLSNQVYDSIREVDNHYLVILDFQYLYYASVVAYFLPR